MQELFVMIPKQKKYHIMTALINTGQRDLLQQMVGVLLHHAMVCCGFRLSITETIKVPNFFELTLCKQAFLLCIWKTIYGAFMKMQTGQSGSAHGIKD